MKILKNMDKWLLLITIILCAIGSIMIFSASNVSSYMRYETSPYHYLIRQVVIIFIGLVFACMTLMTKTKIFSRFATFITYLLLISLPLLFVFGIESNDAQSWFRIGSFNFQPSEFLKVFAIIWIARYYNAKKEHTESYVGSLYPIFICVLAFLAIALQPDLGTAVLFALIIGVLFLLSPVDKKIKRSIFTIGGGLVIILGLILLVGGKNLLSDRQMSRITSVINSSPCSEDSYYTDGNQVCNGYIAINNGGLTGRGLGKSIQKYLYLPEAHTDFIFCIIVEELGLIFGIFIIFLYIILLARIIIIGRKSLNNCDALICYGVAFYFFIHIIINLCGVFGLLPMTGVPLPFMSYGGSYTLCLFISLALVQRINVETQLKRKQMVGK